MGIRISNLAVHEFASLARIDDERQARVDLAELLAHAQSTRTATPAGASGRTRYRVRWRGYRYELVIDHGELVQVRVEKAPARGGAKGPRPAGAERGTTAGVARAGRASSMEPARRPEGRATSTEEHTARPRSSGPSGASPTQEERRARNLPIVTSVSLYQHELDALDEQAREAGLSRSRYVARLILER